MKRRKFSQHHRRGTIVVLSCFLMIAMLAMVAFAVDLGYLVTCQTELRRTADASALAACYRLLHQPVAGVPVDVAANVNSVPTVASQYAGLNAVGRASPTLGTGDVIVGNMVNPTQSGATINTAAARGMFNAVEVTVRRTAEQNGRVPMFFGRVLGSEGQSTTASATAAFINNFSGFRVPSSEDGPLNLMILPFALDLQTWTDVLAGSISGTTDNWSYSDDRGVFAAADGVREVNLFPQGTGSPGNRGTVDIGSSNNSTSDLVRQILYGITPADMAYFPNSELKFNDSGHLYLNGDTGISAGCKAALAAIIGQTRIIPIFASVSRPGNNATYDIVAWGGVRILAVDLTGSMSSKHLTVQPAPVTTRGGIASTSSTQVSNQVYSPVWLVK